MQSNHAVSTYLLVDEHLLVDRSRQLGLKPCLRGLPLSFNNAPKKITVAFRPSLGKTFLGLSCKNHRNELSQASGQETVDTNSIQELQVIDFLTDSFMLGQSCRGERRKLEMLETQQSQSIGLSNVVRSLYRRITYLSLPPCASIRLLFEQRFFPPCLRERKQKITPLAIFLSA